MSEERCKACGQRLPGDEKANAEIALANIMAILREPGALAVFQRVLRHLGGVSSGVVRMFQRDAEEAALKGGR